MTDPLLPGGTITLLFTDIEESSSRWDRSPTAMRSALVAHDAILSQAIAGHHGSIVKHKGDGYFAAFSSALDAVGAGVAAQRALASADWPVDVGTLRVRMALHTGVLEPTGGDYHGPEVNKVARLEAVAHGGQVLLSSAAAHQVIGSLPTGVELRDLGEYRLRSLAGADHIFQLSAPGMMDEFPPLRTEAFARRAIPAYQTSFVGRDHELNEIAELLSKEDCRLLTLLGPGGTGKTRLAVESATRLAPNRSHGAAFVSLAAVSAPDSIISAIAEALDFKFDLHSVTAVDHKTQLFDFVAGQRLLLVLDNFEHLLSAAPLVTALLDAAPGVDVVVTSRHRLNAEGEWVLDIGGMEVEEGDRGGRLPRAAQLFGERAGQARPDFDINEANVDDVLRICRLVNGLPLGIELAAPWVTMLPCREIADEIEKNLDFLESDKSDGAGRHRSLRAVFDSSWDLLSQSQQHAFRRLAVFSAPFTPQAAEKVAEVPLRTLMELGSKSLVRQLPDASLHLHPVLRQYACELLPAPELRELRSAHARYYGDRLLVRVAALRGGSNQLDAAAELAEEHDHLRAAVEWSVVHLSEEEAQAILEAAYQFYLNLGWFEGQDEFAAVLELLGGSERFDPTDPGLPYLWAAAYLSVFEAALAHVDECDALLQRVLPAWEKIGGRGWATCRYSQGVVAAERGDLEAARVHLSAALDESRRGDDAVLTGIALLWYGWVILELGDVEESKRLFDECVSVMSNPTNHWGKAFALSKLGVAADGVGEHRRAAEYHHESREMFVKANDLAGQAYTLTRLSATYYRLGDFDTARQYGIEGLELFERVNHRWGISASLCQIGFVELRLGDVDAAADRFCSALAKSEEAGLSTLIRLALIGVGSVLVELGSDDRAAELLGFALALTSLPGDYREMARPARVELERRLGADAMASARVRGEDMDQSDAIRSARVALTRTSHR